MRRSGSPVRASHTDRTPALHAPRSAPFIGPVKIAPAVASATGLCETAASLRRQAMKRTGSEMPPQDESSTSTDGSMELFKRARLQADVAGQRLRLAKEELRRARRRLKEAKREAKRTRKYASAARKDWKRARRQAKKDGSTETQRLDVKVERLRKPKVRLAARSQRVPIRSSRKRARRRARGGAAK